SQGAEYIQIRGGGTKHHPRTNPPPEYFLFEMNGSAVYRLVARHLPSFVDRLLDRADVGMEDIDLVIPTRPAASQWSCCGKSWAFRRKSFCPSWRTTATPSHHPSRWPCMRPSNEGACTG